MSVYNFYLNNITFTLITLYLANLVFGPDISASKSRFPDKTDLFACLPATSVQKNEFEVNTIQLVSIICTMKLNKNIWPFMGQAEQKKTIQGI